MPAPDVDSSGTQHRCRKGSEELSKKRTNSFKTALDNKSRLHSPPARVNQSSQETQEMPLNMLIKEKILKEDKPHRNSPNVYAKLMGLDSLPSPHPMPKQKKKTKFNELPRQISSVGSKKQKSSGDHSFKLISKELQDFKDVFEVMDASEVENCKNHCIEKGSPKLRTDKENDYISKKTVESKHPPNDEKVHYCDGQSDVFEETHVCADDFPELLQGSSPFLNKHGQDLNAVPRDNVISKSSEVCRNENGEILQKSKRKIERKTQMQKKDRKHSGDYGHSASPPCSFDESKIEGKKESCSNTTRIVVLKPSLETTKRIVSAKNSAYNFLSSKRKPKERCKSGCHNHKFPEVKVQHLLSDKVNVLRHNDSIRQGKTAKERIQNRICNWNDSLNMMNHGDNEFGRTRSSSHRFEYRGLTDVEALTWNSKCSYDVYSYHKPSFHAAEPSATREVGKHHTGKRTISQRSEYVRRVGQHLDTLGDMLTLSEKESHVHFLSKEIRDRWDEPSGISSRDGWKDVCLKDTLSSIEPINQTGSLGSEDEECFTLKDILNLSSRTLKEKVFVQKPSFRKVLSASSNSLPPNFRCEKNEQPPYTAENSHADVWNSSVKFYDAVPIGDEFVVSDSDREVSSKFDVNELQLTPSPVEIISDDGLLVNRHQITTCKPPASNGTQQFDLVSKEDDYPNTCWFKRVNADIQALRLQLGLLKHRPNDTILDDVSDISCIDDTNITPPPPKLTVGDDDDNNNKDFCYVLDMLTLAGLNDISLLSIPAAYYNLPEAPVGPEIFEKLEKLYGGQHGWSRAERRLLFDITNSIIYQYFLSWIKSRRRVGIINGKMLLLTDEVWRLSIKKRNELRSGDPADGLLDKNWLWVIDETHTIGEEIENVLMDELIDELLSKLLLRITR